MIWAFFGFLKMNIKWVAIIVLVLAGLFMLWKYSKMVSELATAKHVISQLEENIRVKDETIKFERDLRVILEDSLERIQKDNDRLNEALENIGENLGEDSENLAPGSIREVIKRLRDIP